MCLRILPTSCVPLVVSHWASLATHWPSIHFLNTHSTPTSVPRTFWESEIDYSFIPVSFQLPWLNIDQNNMGKKRLTSSSTFQVTIGHLVDLGQELKEGAWWQELRWGPRGNTAYWLPFHGLLALLTSTTLRHLLRDGNSRSGRDSFTSIVNQENASHMCIQANLIEVIP